MFYKVDDFIWLYKFYLDLSTEQCQMWKYIYSEIFYVKLQICQYMNFDQADNKFHNFLTNKDRDIWFVAFSGSCY